MKRILFIFGTRPEAIKMAPLIKEFKRYNDLFDVKICITAQHRKMLDSALNFFDILPDYDLNIMGHNQSLFDITSIGLKGLEKILNDNNFDLILVQGDTTSTFIGSLSGYYKKIKVAHIEAGLRSSDKYSPYPEEINRIITGHIADYHFAPTENAKNNLLKENITNNVYVVGNSVIDALFLGLSMIEQKGEQIYKNFFNFIDLSRRIILITGHRRESFGRPLEEICCAIKELSVKFKDVIFVYPVHLNPNVRKPVFEILDKLENVKIIEPLDYPHFIWLMKKSFIILTDSGGVQEEGPSLGKPVIVMREVTERTEGIEAKTAKLAGSDRKKIIFETENLLSNKEEYDLMSKSINPYGDGTTSKKIVNILIREFKEA